MGRISLAYGAPLMGLPLVLPPNPNLNCGYPSSITTQAPPIAPNLYLASQTTVYIFRKKRYKIFLCKIEKFYLLFKISLL
jgi:hypothetical protein